MFRSSLPSVGPLLFVVEAMGKIERDQAEVGGRGAPTLHDHNMLMARRTGFQLQISGMGLAVGKAVIEIGMLGMAGVVAGEAFPGSDRQTHRLLSRALDHAAVFAQG